MFTPIMKKIIPIKTLYIILNIINLFALLMNEVNFNFSIFTGLLIDNIVH